MIALRIEAMQVPLLDVPPPTTQPEDAHVEAHPGELILLWPGEEAVLTTPDRR